MAEERFISQYDGTTQDNLLKFAENVKKATTVDGSETVNVQGFTLPRISDISGFVAVSNAGNAIGFMSKEQVASVLGELIAYPFMYRERNQYDLNSLSQSGYYYVEKDLSGSTNYIGGLLHFSMDQTKIQIISDVFSGSLAYRVYRLSGGSWGWTGWKQI